MKRERMWLTLINLLLLMASGLMAYAANGQGLNMPAHLSRDPVYWYNLYQAERLKVDALKATGTKAIGGLESDLDAANEIIGRQNETIVEQTQRGDRERDRANAAEARVKPLQERVDKLEGKTWVGKRLRKARDGLAAVGGVAILISLARLL